MVAHDLAKIGEDTYLLWLRVHSRRKMQMHFIDMGHITTFANSLKFLKKLSSRLKIESKRFDLQPVFAYMKTFYESSNSYTTRIFSRHDFDVIPPNFHCLLSNLFPFNFLLSEFHSRQISKCALSLSIYCVCCMHMSF